MSVKITSGDNCAYVSTTPNTCVSKICSAWNNTLGVNCSDFAGPNSCVLANLNYCYVPTTCESYIIPS